MTIFYEPATFPMNFILSHVCACVCEWCLRLNNQTIHIFIWTTKQKCKNMFSFFHMHTQHRQTQCQSQTCTRKMNEIKKKKERTKRINLVNYKIIINTQTNGTKKKIEWNNVFIRTLQMKNARKSNRTANRQYKYLINCLSYSFLTGNYSCCRLIETTKKKYIVKSLNEIVEKIEMLFTRVAMQRLYPSA